MFVNVYRIRFAKSAKCILHFLHIAYLCAYCFILVALISKYVLACFSAILRHFPLQLFIKFSLISGTCSRMNDCWARGGSIIDSCSRYLCNSAIIGSWSNITSVRYARNCNKMQNNDRYVDNKIMKETI